MSDDLLFIYGTLLPGCAPQAMADLCRRLKPIGPATVLGQIYDLGPYPAVVIDPRREGIVQGHLVEVDSMQTWEMLDRYEGCPCEGEGDGLYRRIRTIATAESGDSGDCWIYVYNRDLSEARAKVIESGCWRTHRGLL